MTDTPIPAVLPAEPFDQHDFVKIADLAQMVAEIANEAQNTPPIERGRKAQTRWRALTAKLKAAAP